MRRRAPQGAPSHKRPSAPDLTVLATPVAADGSSKPFSEFTLANVQARAAELRAAAGWGPTARVASVARAWNAIASAMMAAGAATVAELPPDEAAELGRRAWVVPPAGSLL